MEITVHWTTGLKTTHEVHSIDHKDRLVVAFNQLGQSVLILSPLHFQRIEIQR